MKRYHHRQPSEWVFVTPPGHFGVIRRTRPDGSGLGAHSG